MPLDEAQARVLEGARPLPGEVVELAQAIGRVLAEPATAAITVPPWDNSAMDGFAVRSADIEGAGPASPAVLEVLGEVPAGKCPRASVKPGTALRITTGARMPRGADAVVPVEDTDAIAGAAELPDQVAILAASKPGDNIRRAGSDVEVGTPILPEGRTIGPAAVALLAATGNAAVRVRRRPRVAVLSTGDEIVPPGRPLGPAQIYDSNALSLEAQAAAAGAEVRRFGIARDEAAALLSLMREAVAWADVVVLSGGVSVGAHDHVKAAFESVGRMSLWRVAIKPGRPFAFARATRTEAGEGTREVALFGLPGNPVSVFVTFELIMRPVLRRLAGHPVLFDRPTRTVRVAEPMRGSSGRQTVARVVLAPDPDRPDGLVARSSGGQDSHMLFSLARANGILFIPPDVDLPAGAEALAWELRGRDA
jgi:molybdenum cofactor synthesis domain-containing protein